MGDRMEQTDYQTDSKANILLVDDRPENLLALEAILEPLNQNLIKANSGHEALKFLLSDDFAVILLDVQMPELDGLEATKRLRRELPGERQPYVIAMTANAFDEDRDRCIAAGMDDYLSKPVRREELGAALGRVTPRHLAKSSS